MGPMNVAIHTLRFRPKRPLLWPRDAWTNRATLRKAPKSASAAAISKTFEASHEHTCCKLASVRVAGRLGS